MEYSDPHTIDCTRKQEGGYDDGASVSVAGRRSGTCWNRRRKQQGHFS